MYHRISRDGGHGKLSVEQFRSQVKLIKKSFSLLSMDQLIHLSEQGEVPDYSAVITFDDGYHDFLDYAFPILQEENAPATLFITTGFINNDIWLWPDQLKYVLEKVPKGFRIDILGISDKCILCDDVLQAWDRIADYCLSISNDEKLRLIDSIFSKAGIKKPEIPPAEFRPLSWGEISNMVSEGLEIGSHSHSHPILTKLSRAQLRTELTLSKSLIEKHLNLSPKSFCYPNGRSIDINSEIKSEVAMAGYKFALAAYTSKDPLSDRWEVTRYAASTDSDQFKKNLYGMTYLSSALKIYI